jgi:outer membrane protein OmpA-like peptidoglycan-associated protein
MKKIGYRLIFICFLFCFTMSAKAQNLVPNAGFEGGWACPEDYTAEPVKELLPYWKNPNRGTPDYFHRCSDKAGIPENFAGIADAAEGDAYVGLILQEVFRDTLDKKRPAREYLEVELNERLEFRQLYCFTMKYRHASGSVYATDGLGVAFTREQMKAWNFGVLTAEPMVFNLPGKVMDNKTEWKELCGVFRARGREQYLTIGNFAPDMQKYYYQNQDTLIDSSFVYAYYYFDELTLFKIENHFECGCLNENSMGYDWLSDDPKSYLDYFYENLEAMENAQLLAMNDKNNQGENQGNDSSNAAGNQSGSGNNKNNTDSGNKQTENGGDENSSDANSNGDNNTSGETNQSGSETNQSNASDSGTESKNENNTDADNDSADLANGNNTNSSNDEHGGNANTNQFGNDGSSNSNGSGNTGSVLVNPIDTTAIDNQMPGKSINDLMSDSHSRQSGEDAEALINSMRDANTGYSIDLPSIYFAFNQSELLPSSYPSMEHLAKMLQEETSIMIEIRGHTDNVGSNRYNKKLSIERAESVYDFLIESGIDEERLKYRGFGNSDPIADNDTEFGRQLNRRVEIKVISNE